MAMVILEAAVTAAALVIRIMVIIMTMALG
jgi:hypothetical protein